MRQRDPLSAAEEREFEALERALAGEPVAADLRDLADLVRDIRATAPEMSPGFEAGLAHQVAEGFAESREPAPRRRPRRRLLIGAGGCLAAALAALVVVLDAGHSGRDAGEGLASTTTATGPQAQAAIEQSRQAPAGSKDAVKPDGPAAAPDSAPTAPAPSSAGSAIGSAGPTASSAKRGAAGANPSTGSATSDPAAPAPSVGSVTSPRKVQRNADLTLQVKAGELDDTAAGVVRTVDRFGGIVASSQIGSDDGSGGEATFDLRIPTGRLDDALAALSRLGHVAARHQALQDITGSFTSAEDRLADARAERRGLLRALGQASSPARIDSLKARLRIVRGEIARRNGDLDALRRRADLSTVSVTVRSGAAATPGDDGSGSGGGWSPADAARDALHVLEVVAGVLLVGLAVAVPLALLGGLVALGVRSGRRRRREGALDAA